MKSILNATQLKQYNHVLNKTKLTDLEEKLLKLFSKAKGLENSLNQSEIFAYCYGKSESYTDFEIYFLWKRIIQTMSRLRKIGFMFIVSIKLQTGDKAYFVPIRLSEIEEYRTSLLNLSKGCLKMADKSKDYIKSKRYTKIKNKNI